MASGLSNWLAKNKLIINRKDYPNGHVPFKAYIILVNHWCHRIILTIAQLALVIMLCTVFMNVVLRFCFNSGIGWAEEVPRLLVMLFTFLACAIGVRDHMHISVDILYNRFPKGGKMRKFMDFLADFATFICGLLIFIYGILFFGMRMMTKNGGGFMGGVGKSNAKVYVEEKTGVTFADVAGQDEAKESLREMVDFLHNPSRYLKIGAKLPKGALLVGPPGTGKTLLAKAVAGEANVPFFSLSGSGFVEMFVGVGASRVRDLFKQAQSMAPCIIFIDEIDAIGKSRDSHYGGGNDEREQTLNQLLAEMDGFDTSKGIIILAATNRPEVLDKALLRPGRFDRRVIVEKPDLKGRVETLKVHSKDVKMDETVDLEAIALATAGAVGSDLANMVNEAALAAVKAGREYVSQKDLFEAVEVVIAGKEKKDRILNEEEKRIVSYHEARRRTLFNEQRANAQ